jgi:hypothetical protein
MAAEAAPAGWLWAHDAQPGQIGRLSTGDAYLIRLSAYGSGPTTRYAALLHQGASGRRIHAIDLTPADLGDLSARPVTVTATAGTGGPRFGVVLDEGPGAPSTVHVGLDAAGLHALADDRHVVTDLAPYLDGVERRYAAVVEERAGRHEVLTGLTVRELGDRLKKLGGAPVRVRSYVDGGRPLLAAIVDPERDGYVRWYADVDADRVAGLLERHRAYPIDLDASRDGRGVRFTVVMRR